MGNVKRIREFTQSMPRKWAEQREGKVQTRLSQAVCSDGMRGLLLCRVLVPFAFGNSLPKERVFMEDSVKVANKNYQWSSTSPVHFYNMAYTKHTLSFSYFSFFRNVLLANFIHPPALSSEFASSTGSFPLPFMSKLGVLCSRRKHSSYNVLLIFYMEFYISFSGFYPVLYFYLTHKMILGTMRHSVNKY